MSDHDGEVRMQRWFAVLAAVAGFLGVVAGTFGAHGLEGRVSEDLLETFEIGVRYQMYHALALLGVAWAADRFGGRWIMAAGWLFVAGLVIFPGTLYLLTLTGVRWWGAVTPIGGVCFLLGWLALLMGLVAAGRSAWPDGDE
jgi:uncharacterized membrane protein YgdD (TMEM256/DUF423 family)